MNQRLGRIHYSEFNEGKSAAKKKIHRQANPFSRFRLADSIWAATAKALRFKVSGN